MSLMCLLALEKINFEIILQHLELSKVSKIPLLKWHSCLVLNDYVWNVIRFAVLSHPNKSKKLAQCSTSFTQLIYLKKEKRFCPYLERHDFFFWSLNSIHFNSARISGAGKYGSSFQGNYKVVAFIQTTLQLEQFFDFI